MWKKISAYVRVAAIADKCCQVNNRQRQGCKMCPRSFNINMNWEIGGIAQDAGKRSQDGWSESEKLISKPSAVCGRWSAGDWVDLTASMLNIITRNGMWEKKLTGNMDECKLTVKEKEGVPSKEEAALKGDITEIVGSFKCPGSYPSTERSLQVEKDFRVN